MSSENVEKKVEEAIFSLENYFERKGIDPYQELQQRAHAIFLDAPGYPLEYPEWVENLSEDEKKALSYLWSLAVRMKGYVKPELEYTISEILNEKGIKEFLDLHQRLVSSRSDKH